jgi:N-carbamoylputrescine amidase
MKIALVQQHATEDIEDNKKRGVLALERAAKEGAEIIAYPELAFLPFLPQNPAEEGYAHFAETVPGPTTELFSKKARELGVVVVLNLFEREGKETYDTSPVIDSNGEIVGKTRMVHVIEAPCFHETGYYAPGDLGAGVFETSAGRVGVAICYDRHFPEYMRALALKGAELVVVPQAGAVDEWPAGIFEAELQVAAFHNGYFTALANRVGEERCITFAGESFVTAPDGRVLARAPRGEDHILCCEMDRGEVERSHARRHFLPDRRPEVYENL